MKANDVKTRTCTEFEAENDDQNPKIRIGDGVRISKYTNLLAKGYFSNQSKEVCVMKIVKNTIPWI